MCKVLFLHGNVFWRTVGNVVKLLLHHTLYRLSPRAVFLQEKCSLMPCFFRSFFLTACRISAAHTPPLTVLLHV